MRLTGTSLDCYKYLEPLYLDYRKIRTQTKLGSTSHCLKIILGELLKSSSYFNILQGTLCIVSSEVG